MNRQQANQYFTQEYLKAQKDEVFPEDLIPEGYNLWKHAAMNFVSTAFMRQNFPISWNEYKALLMKTKGYSFYEVFIINTIIEHRSPYELDRLIADNYYDVIDTLIKMNKKWGEIMEPIESSISKKIEIMSTAQRGNFKEGPMKSIISNNKSFGDA